MTQYHYAIMDALKPLLEYNPEADLGDERLNQPTIQTRIEAAKNGLQKTQDKLTAAQLGSGLNDPTKDDLQQTIGLLLTKLENFNMHEKPAWYAAVLDAQKSVASNREKFWQKQLSQRNTEFTVTNELLANFTQ